MREALATRDTAAAGARSRDIRRGVWTGLLGHAVAVIAAVLVAVVPDWEGLEALAAGPVTLVVVELAVFVDGLVTVIRPRTRARGIGFFYSWLGTWLAFAAAITLADLI